MYIKTGNYETAEKLINRAYDLHPGSSRTQYNLGLINYIKGEVTGSREAYVKSLKYLDRASIGLVKYPKLNLLRAKVLLKLGEVKRAMAEVERAVAYGLEGELLEEANSIKKMYEDPGNNDPGKDTHK